MARENEIRYVNLYMAGSAAYQLEPVRPQKKAVRLPKAPKQKKVVIRVDPLTILGFVVAAVMIISMAVGVYHLNQIREETAVLQEYVTRLESENAQLQSEYRQGYDLEEIRRYAEAMGLVPIWQVEKMQIQVQQPALPEKTTAWESFCLFLSGLFA